MRFERLLLFVVFLPLCWLGMMIVHELGHVLVGWATGGQVTRVVLHPLAISRTDVEPDPHPMLVAWGGPVLGVGLPLITWLITRAFNRDCVYLLRFFAGFCAVANGAYLAGGSFYGAGDAGDLLRLGVPTAVLQIWGLATIALGLAIWHKSGADFGFGASSKQIPKAHLDWCLAVLAAVLILELALSERL